MEGWIKIYRSLRNWEWYQNSEMVHLFVHLLLIANHKDKKWQGIEVKRGQIITGRKRLSEATGISENKIRHFLKRLSKSGCITIKVTTKYSLLTICNYDYYQNKNQEENQQRTSNKPANNQQQTTNNNKKENNNEKEKYSQNVLKFYEKIILLFPERTRPQNNSQKEKWLSIIKQLSEKQNYSFSKIQEITEFIRKDEFWRDNFLSIPKLVQKNREGILYIDVFNEKFKSKKPDYQVKANKEYDKMNIEEYLKF